MDDPRSALEAKLAEIDDQMTTLEKKPADQGSISFGKRIGEGTSMAVDRLTQVVDWRVERVERAWAGLRSFAPDRLPVYGYDLDAPGFFWCAGQGGFGIQTAPAAARLAAGLLLGKASHASVAHIDASAYAPERFAR